MNFRFGFLVSLFRISNRFEWNLVTTDSTTSEDDTIPPPLPAKTRDSNDYSNLPISCVNIRETGNENYSIIVGRWGNRPLPAEPNFISNSSYDYVDAQSLMEKQRPRPPTPPPKPSRNSKITCQH